MSDDWDRYQGDTNDTIVMRIDGVDDLLGASSVDAIVWRTTTPSSQTVLTATVVDASARTVRVSLGSWVTTAAVGVWNVASRITGTWSDGTTGRRTFPEKGGGTITIRKAGT